MKPLLVSLALLFALYGNSQTRVVAQLRQVLRQKNYFALRSLYNREASKLNAKDRLYFTAFINNAFNRNQASNLQIDQLLTHYPQSFDSATTASLLLLKEDNFFKLYQYSASAGVEKLLIDRYRNALDSSTYLDLANKYLIRNALSSIPAQQTTMHGNQTLRWKRNILGLMEISLRFPSGTFPFVFDTRANISSVTASYARSLKLRMLNVHYQESSGATGNSFESTMGIADSLWIGSILVQHVVFQVFPDSILYIAPLHYTLNAILGYPVIRQVREVHLLQNGTMLIPRQPTHRTWHNLAMDQLDPLVAAVSGNDTLSFYFDTGANTTELYSTFFDRFAPSLSAQIKDTTVQVGGAGGVTTLKVYRINTLPLRMAGSSFTLHNLDIRRQPVSAAAAYFYGNMGQDVLQQFAETIINFEDMYIEFRKK